jgi:hypothetical protein
MEELDLDAPTTIQTKMSEEEELLDRADSVYMTLNFTKLLKVDSGLRSL